MVTIDYKQTGRNIRKRIAEKDITPTNLIYRMGLAWPSTVYAWMNGIATPRLDNLVMICDILGCTLDEIVARKDVE